MRNPNGYGSIVRLSGNRRRPFCVRKAVTEWNEKGYPIYEVIGYFSTKKEAIQALAEFNKDPYDLKRDAITFSQMYEEWSKKKYPEISYSLSKGYEIAYRRLESIANLPVTKLRTPMLQDLLDGMELSAPLKYNIKLVLKMVLEYAVERDILTRNVAVNLKTPAINSAEKHPFTEKEIKRLWNNLSVPYVEDLLIMIYTGWRIQEYCTIKTSDVDLENGLLKGGMKTEAGKNRIVPIHHRILPLVRDKFDPNAETLVNIPYNLFRSKIKTVLRKLDLDHTPHETRHTFVTLLDAAGADPQMIKRLVGHSLNDVTNKVYVHKDIVQLKQTIELLP